MQENNYQHDSHLRAYDYKYHSPLSVKDCIERIMLLPWVYEFMGYGATGLLGIARPFRYDCKPISDNRLLITFTGGPHRGPVYTEYTADFQPSEQGTTITMRFKRERLFRFLLWKLPFSFTSTQEVDAFMKYKTSAERTN